MDHSCHTNLAPKLPNQSAHNHQHQQDHNKHAGHSVAMFRDRFWLSLILTIPVILYSHMMQDWLNFTMPVFIGSALIPFIFGTFIFFYGGLVFIKSAVAELQAKLPGMMTLISLAIISAFAYSILTTFWIAGTDFFWELTTLIVVMLLGHWMEMRSVSNAQGALKELAKLLPDTAELESGKKILTSELQIGDILLVKPGSKIPADGKIISGQTQIDESMITGESQKVNKVVGDKVIAGSVNGNSVIKIQVTNIGESTILAGIMRLVNDAQLSKTKIQILADKAAFYLTIVAIIAGVTTFAGWLIAGFGLGFALERTVTVLVIACPHALGLAIPLVTSISTTLGAKKGLLVRQRSALESARNINVVLFDKTGTLTKGVHGLVDIWPHNTSEQTLLQMTASLEANSEHVIGKAVIEKATQNQLTLLPVTNFKAIPGVGVEGMVQNDLIKIGGPQLLNTTAITIPSDLQNKIDQAGKNGKTVVYVIVNNNILGVLTFADIIREESKSAVDKLRSQNIRIAMLTGDSQAVAAYVANQLGITEYFAEVLPEHKSDIVKKLQTTGARVAMVGDGINDAPALAQADIGIAIGAGTDVAIEAAGIVLIKSNPLDIPNVIKLSRETYKKMIQNLVWATGYNTLAIPLAAGVLFSFGIILPPAIGALLMSISTIVVALNAQLLRNLSLNNN